MVQIYAILDPRSGRVRYVGRTNQGMGVRLGQHLRDAEQGVKIRPLCCFLRKMIRLGLEVEIRELIAVPEGLAAWWESYFIRWYREIEPKLANLAGGGEGGGGIIKWDYRECCWCGETFRCKPAKKRKFCSHRCATASFRKPPKPVPPPRKPLWAVTPTTCSNCGKLFPKRHAGDKKKCCSPECVSQRILAGNSNRATVSKPRRQQPCTTCGRQVVADDKGKLPSHCRACSRHAEGSCLRCGAAFAGRWDKKYCSATCKDSAKKKRRASRSSPASTYDW